MKWGLVALAVLAGLSNPVQSASNSGLNKAIGQVIPAVLAIYVVALVGLAVCAPFFGLSLRDLPGKAAAAPWWAWLGGFCNLMFVMAATIATKQIGSAVFTVTATSCAVVLSIILDQLGTLGLDQHPISVLRLIGGAMAIGGVALVAAS